MLLVGLLMLAKVFSLSHSFSMPTFLLLTNYSLFINGALLEKMTRFSNSFLFPIFSLRDGVSSLFHFSKLGKDLGFNKDDLLIIIR